MRCRRVQLQLLDFSLGRLEEAAASATAAHLERCPDCRRVLRREQRVAAMLGTMPSIRPREDAWPAVEAELRTAVRPPRPRVAGWRPFLWAGSLAAAAAIAAGLVAPVRPSSVPVEPEMLRTLAPAVAAGLGQERPTDPLMEVQGKLDRLMRHVADQGT